MTMQQDDVHVPQSPPHGSSWDEWARWAEGMPVSRRIGLRCLQIEAGRVVVEMKRSDWPLNPNGAVHGGALVACADQVLGIVTMTMLAPSTLPATASISADYLRPAFPPLTFEAVVDRIGASMSFVTVLVRDRTGKLTTKVHGTLVLDGSSRHLAG
ncbi:PaaI family thioesterase [Rhodococcus opacus]|uniref:PaaI family thioesterase n=1 Tax=Rhodococcus opacus TaxID=37919 RepID=UPI000EA8F70C|nr:PaaI family thioesterase [Rhodococcus opacus]MDT2006368.1 PaaI family thioesterase [Rhodococcus opacus]QZS56994.1 PaaI family thioesterase [Rhodococcus opacus]RKM76382.1 hypothetical protein COO55_33075 [Rhodococcus opacus]WKN53306.1 PaaI family thioesterase [Rhodococcus opacus]